MLPTGRCGGCRAAVGPAPWVLEIAAALVFGLLPGRPLVLLPVMCWVAAFGVVLGAVDAAVHRLPDGLTLSAFLGTAVLLVAAATAAGTPGVLLRCLGAALAMGAGYGFLALLGPMGLGDVKLAPTLGALLGWFGWGTVIAGLFAGFLLAGVSAASLLVSGRAGRGSALAFGPFMLTGTLVAVLAATR
jgi:leader peptidase (prepilin peptidase)/N-methyltransferase